MKDNRNPSVIGHMILQLVDRGEAVTTAADSALRVLTERHLRASEPPIRPGGSPGDPAPQNGPERP